MLLRMSFLSVGYCECVVFFIGGARRCVIRFCGCGFDVFECVAFVFLLNLLIEKVFGE